MKENVSDQGKPDPQGNRSDICYVYRKREPGFHSVETVFSQILPFIEPVFTTSKEELPEAGADPGSVVRNLRKGIRDRSARLYHVTGHVNYMVMRLRSRSVLTVHDLGSVSSGPALSRWIKFLVWFRLPVRLAGKVTAVSGFTLEELQKRLPRSARKGVVIHNPLGTDCTFNPASSLHQPVRILLIGTKPNKNLERTLEAIEGLPVELTIIGKLTDRQMTLLRKDNIPYTNREGLSREELLQCYRDTDLLCFASTYEGFGLPIIEAQAIGRPVVTSNRGAMKEVAGVAACLVDPEDPQSIRKGIQQVLTDESYRSRLVEDGRVNAHRFRAEAISEKYADLYKAMLSDPAK